MAPDVAIQVEDIVHHPRVSYAAKDFDEQEGYMLSLVIAPKSVVEVGVYMHWLNKQPVDVAVDVSCMTGCTERCAFCAAADLPGRHLSVSQIVAQVSLALEHMQSRERQFFTSLGMRPRLTVSFEGMGEPSQLPAVVVSAINVIRNNLQAEYDIRFQVSTLGTKPDALALWAALDPPLHSLQVSVHAVNDNTRRELLRKDVPLTRVLDNLDDFAKSSPTTQIKLNYVLISGVNDTEQDASALCALLAEKPYYLKIARLNATAASRRNNLSPPSENDYTAFLSQCGNLRETSHTYAYGSGSEIKISCGQLASYGSAQLDLEARKTVAQIYKRLVGGNAILFIGAGASHTLWNASSLAKQLYEPLGFDATFEQSGLSLGSVADIYSARNQRNELYDFLRREMGAVRFPNEYRRLAALPWKAIYTTNYDELLERAFEAANQDGSSRVRLKPIRENTDLSVPLEAGTIPLVKLHGCISRPSHEQVVSDGDYLAGYRTEREYLFRLFELDILRCDVVFIGYGFHDQYLRSLVSRIKREGGSHTNTAAWAIAPASEFSQDLSKTYYDQFGIALVSATAQSFVDELARLQRKPVVLVSGSRRRDLRGAYGAPTQLRRDVGASLELLATSLGPALEAEGVDLVTGATATDKFGYMVAAEMDWHHVTTLVWGGAEEVKDGGNRDDIARMIRATTFGTSAADVIDRTTDLAQIVVFAGGSAMTLQEFQAASSKGKVVIPVALGDERYASDLIHSFLSGNHNLFTAFDADIGYKEKEGRLAYGSPMLTRERLEALRLDVVGVAVVTRTILDIVRENRMRWSE